MKFIGIIGIWWFWYSLLPLITIHSSDSHS